MKKIIIFTLVIMTVLLNSNQLYAKETNLDSLNLSSKNYILYSVDEDRVISEKNSTKQLAAASINKILTTITALDLLEGQDLDKEITVYPQALHYLDREASKAGLMPNQVVTLREVLYAIMLPSGADATALMSLHLFNSQEGLVDAMNEEAKKIGMKHTNIVNTAGLDDSNQYTTLEDLLKLLKYALNNENFKDIYTKVNYSFKHGDLLIENPMLTMASQRSNNYIVGAKSGYTLDANRSLSSVGSDGSETYIFISTQAEGGPYEDNLAFDDANRVYDALFSKTPITNETASTDLLVKTPEKPFNVIDSLLNLSTLLVMIVILLIMIACTLRMYNLRKMRKKNCLRFKS